MQETYSDKLKKFESSNMLYSILQHIIDYFCIKHNLQYYNLSRLPRFVYTFYLMLGFFNKLTIDECNSLLNSKIKPELKKYDIKLKIEEKSQSHPSVLFEVFQNAEFLYIFFNYMFKRLSIIINVLDKQLIHRTLETPFKTFVGPIMGGPFIDFTFTFCYSIDVLVFLIYENVLPNELKQVLISKLHINDETTKTISNVNDENRSRLFTELKKIPERTFINNNNELFYTMTRNADLKNVKNVEYKYHTLDTLGTSLKNDISLIKLLSLLILLRETTDLSCTDARRKIFQECLQTEKDTKKGTDKEIIEFCVKTTKNKIKGGIPKRNLDELLSNLKQKYSFYHLNKLTLNTLKSSIEKSVSEYQAKCKTKTDPKILLVITGLMINKMLELVEDNQIHILKNLANFSKRLIKQMCILNEEQKELFIQEYNKLTIRRDIAVNTEEELSAIFDKIFPPPTPPTTTTTLAPTSVLEQSTKSRRSSTRKSFSKQSTKPRRSSTRTSSSKQSQINDTPRLSALSRVSTFKYDIE